MSAIPPDPAAAACAKMAEGMTEHAESLSGVPNGALVQGHLYAAAGSLHIAAALHRLAAAVERKP